MTKFMYKSKDVALMPNITDDDEPAEARSPFLTPRAKVNNLLFFHIHSFSCTLISLIFQVT